MIKAARAADAASPVAVRSPDPRPARTRAAILAAVERLPSGPADDVTVAAIARDAGVSRGAFYSQFSNLEELLGVVLSDTAARLAEPSPEGDAASVGTVRERARAALTRLVGHVAARSAFYTAASTWKTSSVVHEATRDAYAAQIRTLIEAVRESAPHRLGMPTEEQFDFAATFVAGGLIAALTAWLRTNRATPSATLVEELLALLPEWLVADEVTE